MVYFKAVLNYSVHKCICQCLCVCDDGKSIAVWGDRLRLLSAWWIAECSCFKILLGHSPRLAKGCSLMYCLSWDWVRVCSSLKVCNKCTTKQDSRVSLCAWGSKWCNGRETARKLVFADTKQSWSHSRCCIYSSPCFGGTVWLCN